MRKCLVIGSATYDHDGLQSLPGARADADSVFALLIDPAHGNYDPTSIKLTDPTLEQVRDAVATLVLGEPRVDVFSFYFAGHGDVSGGSFYMLLRDSKIGQLSRTALGIVEVFNLVNEGQPQQVNIVIDACRAGGVILDLSQAIKVESLGTHISPNISLLAAADIAQGAEETAEGGVATTALVRALNGADVTPSSAPYLDLVTLGTHVAARMASAGTEQAPIVWGLNLSGLSRFALNPHADKSAVPQLASMTGVAPTSPISKRLESLREKLWRVYLDLGEGVDPATLSEEIGGALALLDVGAGQASEFVLGLSYSLTPRAKASNEPFADAEVLAVCGAALVAVSRDDPKAAAALQDIAGRFVAVIDAEAADLNAALEGNWRALLTRRGGYGDFVILPLRISRLLGYLGATDTLAELFGIKRPAATAVAERIVQRIVSDFEGALVCVSDQQAAYLSTYFASGLCGRSHAESEKLFGLIFSDFIARDGRVLPAQFSGSNAFNYCWALQTETPIPASVPLAVPTNLLAVLLAAAARMGHADTVDPYMHYLDHQGTNIYIPEKIADFSRRSMPNGVNITISVGAEDELGIFTLEDFQSVFAKHCAPLLGALAGQLGNEEKAAAVFGCLVRPDRILWSVYQPLTMSPEIGPKL
jgi:hypothetical protein